MVSVKKMADANTNQVTCPFCGSINPIGSAFCQDCGKKFSTEPFTEANPINKLQPSNMDSHKLLYRRSERHNNIIIVAVAAILIVTLVFAAFLSMSTSNIDNNFRAAPTPSVISLPTITPTAQPTTVTTPSPTLIPTLQPQSNTITAMNLQFVYQSTDQNNFGPSAQTLAVTNQPDGMLTLSQGSEFWYSFKLTEAISASPDSIIKISTSTPGFMIVSVMPPTPIVFMQGSSVTITVLVQSSQTSFEGAVTLVLTTSG